MFEVSDMSNASDTDDTELAPNGTETDVKLDLRLCGNVFISSNVGAAVALAGITFTLLAYIGYRKLRVKRTHIVMLNLCVSLLVFYISYIISNHERSFSVKLMSLLCVASAFLCHLTILCALFWVAAYWILVLVMFRRPSASHINSFFLKAAIACYLVPIVIAVVTISAAYPKWGESLDPDRNRTVYNNDRCFVSDIYMYLGLLLPSAIVYVMIVIIIASIIKGFIDEDLKVRPPRSVQRVKKHMGKLSVISLSLMLVILASILVPDTESVLAIQVSGIFFSIGSNLLGLQLLFLCYVHRKEIHLNWIAICSGKSHISHHRSVNLSKTNSFSKNTLSMKHQASARINGQEKNVTHYDDHGLSNAPTCRIVPKEDTDMSTLGLIQIPGIPANHEDKRIEEVAKIRDPNIMRKKRNVFPDGEANAAANKVTRSSKLFDKPLKSPDYDVDPPLLKPNVVNHNQVSAEREIVKVTKKLPRQQNCSTSNLKVFGKHLSLKQRQSVLSTDSTQMTNFE